MSSIIGIDLILKYKRIYNVHVTSIIFDRPKEDRY
jgi:hypothetical protein